MLEVEFSPGSELQFGKKGRRNMKSSGRRTMGGNIDRKNEFRNAHDWGRRTAVQLPFRELRKRGKGSQVKSGKVKEAPCKNRERRTP